MPVCAASLRSCVGSRFNAALPNDVRERTRAPRGSTAGSVCRTHDPGLDISAVRGRRARAARGVCLRPSTLRDAVPGRNPPELPSGPSPAATCTPAIAPRSKNSTVSRDRQISSHPPPCSGECSRSTRVRSRLVTRASPPAYGRTMTPPPKSGRPRTASGACTPTYSCPRKLNDRTRDAVR